MLRIDYLKHNLHFKRPAGTSRGTLVNKPAWFIIIKDDKNPQKVGFGECNIIEKLSYDSISGIEARLGTLKGNYPNDTKWVDTLSEFNEWPSIKFGLETALRDLKKGGNRILFDNDFSKKEAPILINGLVWMGDKDFMYEQIRSKLEEGWKCLKLKIGAIDFAKEISLLKYIRSKFNADSLCIRVDANGAFSSEDALSKLYKLSNYQIHSIEQPIASGQWNKMSKLCKASPIPIALDEELIPVRKKNEREEMLQEILPHFIILKPGLLGGFESCNEWIKLAKKMNISFWITSALESNIGLNAIAQYTYELGIPIPQGLGTGQLYTNNINSPLLTLPGQLIYKQDKKWDLSLFE